MLQENNLIEADDDLIEDTNFEMDEVIEFKYSITSYGADYPVDGLVKRIKKDSKSIIIPEFQRSYVWTMKQASRFIESLLLGLPVPGVFFSKGEGNTFLVIDGQQRLKTLEYFYENNFLNKEFRLVNVQKKYLNKNYQELEPEDRRKLDDTIIHATIVKQDEPEEDQSSIYHIFERLNTGGTQLQPQEIRASIYRGPFYSLISELCVYPSWMEIYGNKSKRLKDQELILRFFAFFFYRNNYTKPMKEFLNKFMSKNRDFKIVSRNDMETAFKTSIDLINEAIGKKAFRPERGINASVFDSIMVGTYELIKSKKIFNIENYKKAYFDLLNDKDYIKSAQDGTSDEKTVHIRFNTAIKVFSEI